jgi:hypothetical protein
MHRTWWLVVCLVQLAVALIDNNNNNINNNIIIGPGGGGGGGQDSQEALGPDHFSWSIQQMSYNFNFPLSCDVDVEQTVVMNYTRGNFSSVCAEGEGERKRGKG